MRNPAMNRLQTRSTMALLTAATIRMNAKYVCISLMGILTGCGTASDLAPEEDVAVVASAITSVSTDAQRPHGDSANQPWTMSPAHSGAATFYATVDNGGHCSFGSTGLAFFGAMNHTDYAGSAACGACVNISGPNGSVRVRITNECPECAPGDIDLSQQAFAQLAPIARGRIPISWDYVPCGDIAGPIVYHFKDGSNPYWAALQIRNHVQPIASVAVDSGHGFMTLRRSTDNYFVADSGLGSGPYTVRVTDSKGEVIQDSGIALRPSVDVPSPGHHQFH